MPDGHAPVAGVDAGGSPYRDLVMERARRPLHGGTLDAPDGVADGTNPLCGDSVEVGIRLNRDRGAAAIRHRTRGCAICAASADLMAEAAQGRTAAEAAALLDRFEALLARGEDALEPAERDGLGPLLAFADLHGYRSRRKCATLPWSALLAAFRSSEGGS